MKPRGAQCESRPPCDDFAGLSLTTIHMRLALQHPLHHRYLDFDSMFGNLQKDSPGTWLSLWHPVRYIFADFHTNDEIHAKILYYSVILLTKNAPKRG